MLPSQTLPVICSYRRAHNSVGEQTFINTYLIPMLRKLAPDTKISVDGYGNIHLNTGRDDVMFVAHIDTVHGKGEPTYQKVETKGAMLQLASIDKNARCLGADDGSGIAVMLYLLSQGVKAQYLFTRCEEQGGYGAEHFRKNSKGLLERVKIAVEVDRKGTREIIYEQGVGACASLEFTQQLCYALGLNHKPSDEGSYTDVASFADVIPECVNISAGYYNAHTNNECVDMDYLDELAEKLSLVNWDGLDITREAGDFGYGYTGGDFYNADWGDPKSFGRPLDFETLYDFVISDPEGAAYLLTYLNVTQEDVEIAFGMQEDVV